MDFHQSPQNGFDWFRRPSGRVLDFGWLTEAASAGFPSPVVEWSQSHSFRCEGEWALKKTCVQMAESHVFRWWTHGEIFSS